MNKNNNLINFDVCYNELIFHKHINSKENKVFFLWLVLLITIDVLLLIFFSSFHIRKEKILISIHTNDSKILFCVYSFIFFLHH